MTTLLQALTRAEKARAVMKTWWHVHVAEDDEDQQQAFAADEDECLAAQADLRKLANEALGGMWDRVSEVLA